jgi:hypothetical protein
MDTTAAAPDEPEPLPVFVLRHFLESPEQRLGRQLTKAGYDVVFIPCR